MGEEFNPYEAPEQDDVVMAPETEGYRSLATLKTILTVLLGGYVVLSGAKVVLDLVALTYQAPPGTEAEGTALDVLVPGGTALIFVVYLTIAVFFGIFLYRSNQNARSFHPFAVGFSPASMVWWYFVPIANWFKPFQATREVWMASSPEGIGRSTPLLGWWWGTWLVSQLLSRFGGFEVAELTSLNVVGGLVGIANGVLALLLIRGLTARQEEVARGILAHRHQEASAQGALLSP